MTEELACKWCYFCGVLELWRSIKSKQLLSFQQVLDLCTKIVVQAPYKENCHVVVVVVMMVVVVGGQQAQGTQHSRTGTWQLYCYASDASVWFYFELNTVTLKIVKMVESAGSERIKEEWNQRNTAGPTDSNGINNNIQQFSI